MLIQLAKALAAIGAAMYMGTSHSRTPEFCSNENGIEYCYYKGNITSERVIYFLHGFGDNVQAWTLNFTTGEIEKFWEQQNTLLPHIVTISKGVWWYTSSQEGDEFKRFIEKLEKRLFSFDVERVLYGDSMGGHNAFRWALDHPQLFQKLAMICPAFPRSFVSHPPPSEGFPPYQYLAEQLIAEFYKLSTEPTKNPLVPPANGFGPSHLPQEIYLLATPKDQFGFFAGAQALRNVLTPAVGLTFVYEEQSIDHCNVNSAEKLGTFLAL